MFAERGRAPTPLSSWFVGPLLRVWERPAPFSPAARQSACEPLIDFQGCPALTPAVPCSSGHPGHQQVRARREQLPPASPARSPPGPRGGSRGGASRPGHRPRPALGSPGSSGPGWRGRGLGRGRSAAAGAVAEGTGGEAARPRRRAQGQIDGRTRGGSGLGARSVSGGSAGGAGRGGGEGSREPWKVGGEGRRWAQRRLRSGVGPETSPLAAESEAPGSFPSSFLCNQRKINTREGKTIAGPPGTRRAQRSPWWGGGRGWNREWRPHRGSPSRLAPAEGGASGGAGPGRRRREFPGVKHLLQVLQEQLVSPQLLSSGQGN